MFRSPKYIARLTLAAQALMDEGETFQGVVPSYQNHALVFTDRPAKGSTPTAIIGSDRRYQLCAFFNFFGSPKIVGYKATLPRSIAFNLQGSGTWLATESFGKLLVVHADFVDAAAALDRQMSSGLTNPS